MAYKHAAKILESTTGFLTASDRAALVQMAFVADNRGTIRWSQTEIGSHVGLSRRSVARLYGFLESTALITKDKHGRYHFETELLEVVESLLSPKS